MKHPMNFCQAVILVVINAGLLSCVAPNGQNANLSNSQNSNVAAAPTNSPTISPTEFPIITIDTPSPSPTQLPTIATNSNSIVSNANLGNSNASNNLPTGEYDVVAVDKLIIPVVGIKVDQLRDTFKDARSEGRVHDAIDIMAPQGAEVIAAADGEIARFFDSVKGGITIYQFSKDKKLIYYYAHLQRRADTLQEHQFVKQGAVIGYVGDTGNAGPGNYHLHFAIWTVNDPNHYWDGTNLNPYPLLRRNN